METESDQTIGGYQLLEYIDEGAFGVVFKALRLRGGLYALKWSHPRVCRNEAARSYRQSYPKLFKHAYTQEILLNARVHHEHVNLVIDHGSAEDWPYIVTEYQPHSLDKLLRLDGKLSVPEAVRVARETCQALEAAHLAGVVHLDLRPSNILLTEDYRVKVADFGISKGLDLPSWGSLTLSGLGAPEFTALERLLGPPGETGEKTEDPRSDLYSLGVTLFEMLTGRLPFYGDRQRVKEAQLRVQRSGVMPSVRQSPQEAQEIPEWLDTVVQKAIHPDLGQRFQTAPELREALESHVLPGPDREGDQRGIFIQIIAPWGRRRGGPGSGGAGRGGGGGPNYFPQFPDFRTSLANLDIFTLPAAFLALAFLVALYLDPGDYRTANFLAWLSLVLLPLAIVGELAARSRYNGLVATTAVIMAVVWLLAFFLGIDAITGVRELLLVTSIGLLAATVVSRVHRGSRAPGG